MTNDGGMHPSAGGAPRRASTPQPPPGGRRRGLLVLGGVGVLVLALVIGLVVWANGRGDHTAVPAAPSSVTPKPSPTSETPPRPTTAPSPSKPKVSVPAGCSATQKPLNKPTGFTISRLGVQSQMLSLGWDRPTASNRAPLAPPLDSPTAKTDVAWFDQGPKLGAPKGQAILSIHTYHVGGALGNTLQSSFKVGDLVQIKDASGAVQCYTYESVQKVWVSSYDPKSTVLHDPAGKAQAIIVICWDYNSSNGEWDSRLFYHLKPLGAPAA